MDNTYAVALRYGSSDEYKIIFVRASNETGARSLAYDQDRRGSVVAVERVPR